MELWRNLWQDHILISTPSPTLFYCTRGERRQNHIDITHHDLPTLSSSFEKRKEEWTNPQPFTHFKEDPTHRNETNNYALLGDSKAFRSIPLIL